MRRTCLILTRCIGLLIVTTLLAVLPTSALAEDLATPQWATAGAGAKVAPLGAWKLIGGPALRTPSLLVPKALADARLYGREGLSGLGVPDQAATRPQRHKGAAKALTFIGLGMLAGGGYFASQGLGQPSSCTQPPYYSNSVMCPLDQMDVRRNRAGAILGLGGGSIMVTVGIIEWAKK